MPRQLTPAGATATLIVLDHCLHVGRVLPKPLLDCRAKSDGLYVPQFTHLAESSFGDWGDHVVAIREPTFRAMVVLAVMRGDSSPEASAGHTRSPKNGCERIRWTRTAAGLPSGNLASAPRLATWSIGRSTVRHDHSSRRRQRRVGSVVSGGERGASEGSTSVGENAFSPIQGHC